MIREVMLYDPLNLSDSRFLMQYEDFLSITYNEQIITRKKGFETLTMVFPLDNEKSREFRNERLVRIDQKVFVIKKITKEKSNSKYITIECEALWYQLNDGAPFEEAWVIGTTPLALYVLLRNTGWTAGTIEVQKSHSFLLREGSSPLYMIRFLASLLDAEIKFDTVNKTVNLLRRIGTDTKEIVSYSKNLRGITRIDDTTQLSTRVYMTGADGITISSINGGLPYVEDYSWFDEEGIPRRIMSHSISDERFSVQSSMKEYMEDYLALYSRPIVSYELEQYLISIPLYVGDSIIVADAELEKQEEHRIFEREIDLINPEQSVYVLDNPISDLADRLDDDEDLYTGTTANTSRAAVTKQSTDIAEEQNNALLTKIKDLETRIAVLEKS